MPPGSRHCSVCGHGGGNRKAAMLVWSLFLVFIGGPAGLYGGCMVVFNGIAGPPGSKSANSAIAEGACLLLVPLFFLVMLIRAIKP